MKRDFWSLHSTPVKRDGKTWARDWENEDDLVKAGRQSAGVLLDSTGVRVIIEKRDGYSLVSARAASEWFAPCRMIVENKNGTVSYKPGFKVYLDSPERRIHTSISVDPRLSKKGSVYSTWRGFALKPSQGACPLLMAHLRDVLCGGDANSYEYLIEFLADMLQNPAVKPGLMLVLQGGKGVGKTTLPDLMRQIIGAAHSMKVSQTTHLTGRFNYHLADALLVHIEEMRWAGDKEAEGVLKDLVTADAVTVEAKHGSVETRFNMSRLILCTNERWSVPAGEDERRFLVLDVKDPFAHAKSREERQRLSKLYFDGVYAEIETGGAEAFMGFLMRHKLGTVDLRRPPMTSGLKRQVIQSLSANARLMLAAVEDGGFICGGAYMKEKGAENWSYQRQAEWPLDGDYAVAESDLREALKNEGRVFGHLTSVGMVDVLHEFGEVRAERLRVGDARPRVIVFGPRRAWRDRFAERFGIEFLPDDPAKAPTTRRGGGLDNVVTLRAAA